jgi:hypothetical protein
MPHQPLHDAYSWFPIYLAALVEFDSPESSQVIASALNTLYLRLSVLSPERKEERESLQGAISALATLRRQSRRVDEPDRLAG